MAASYSRRLPFGVALLAVIIGLVGALFAIVGALVLLKVAVDSAVVAGALGNDLTAGILLLVFGIVLLVIATGLWDLNLFALVVCFLLIGLLFVSNLLRGALLTFWGLVELFLLIYLLAVSREFR
ncbi:MAG TPA: hypothetical protein VMH90_06100 [Thermoplasmata archaeon]|nr:hypothetical protein [Thermoplasmata archaeon]